MLIHFLLLRTFLYNKCMKYINTVLGIGIALIIIPVLGFPIFWRNIMVVILGISLCYTSFSMRYYKPPVVKAKRKSTKKHHHTAEVTSSVPEVNSSVSEPVVSPINIAEQSVIE